MAKKTMLMILDGWGKAPNPAVSAVDQAKTPFIDSLYRSHFYLMLIHQAE